MIFKKKRNINKFVKYLILSDLAFYTGYGFFSPILSIFIVQRIQGGDAFVAGAAAAVYWILKSLLDFPIGMLLDDHDGEKDDYLVMTAGTLIAALVPFGYIFAYMPWHIYFFQIFLAIGMSMALCGWRAIFTKHIDRGKEATEWGIDSSFAGIGMGVSGLITGTVVVCFGFTMAFILAGVFGLVSVVVLSFLRKEISGSRKTKHPNIKDVIS